MPLILNLIPVKNNIEIPIVYWFYFILESIDCDMLLLIVNSFYYLNCLPQGEHITVKSSLNLYQLNIKIIAFSYEHILHLLHQISVYPMLLILYQNPCNRFVRIFQPNPLFLYEILTYYVHHRLPWLWFP